MTRPTASSRIALALLAVTTIFAAWLRLHGLGTQIVLDDEWHAIHKLMRAGYADIAATFGTADHSIPLTLFYKALAGLVGLDEIDMRLPQVVAGVALVPLSAWIAWCVARDAAAAVLTGFLIAIAPFLVLYSRFARPYAITTLVCCIALALLWRWRTSHRRRDAVAATVLAAIATWLHPLSSLFFVVAGTFLFVSEVLRARSWSAPAARRAFILGLVLAVAMASVLAWPLAHDMAALSSKAGKDVVTLSTFTRAASIFAGGTGDAVTAIVFVLAIAGAAVVWCRERALGAYLLVVIAGPCLLVALLAPQWAHQGHTFARYVFPVQVIVLGCASVGLLRIVRAAGRAMGVPGLAWIGCIAAAFGYTAITPTITQVTTLGPWFAHAINTYDYQPAWNRALDQYQGYEPPAFYRALGAMAPGEAPIIEAPFNSAAPENPFAWFARFHRQPEKMGMIHPLCLEGPLDGEVPAHDPRFRFREFVALEDRQATLATGARYILLYKGNFHGRPFVEGSRCEAALARLYGQPIVSDARLAVFDLRKTSRSDL